MKKILVTGQDSYIGESVDRWLSHSSDYMIHTIDMRDSVWREHDFSKYDVVFHVAGIAHADVGHVSEERKQFYYKINTELAIETASKAKSAGVTQFIFMSSMIIYGESAPIGKQKIITRDTQPKPANFYGDSKLQADIGVRELETKDFKVVVLRPPMIYGKGSRGNYRMLAKMARVIPIFPNIKNKRSMLHIDNLCEFIKLMIDNEESGIFFPQNETYTRTSEMVQNIARVNKKKILLTSVFNWGVYLCAHIPGKIGKIINKVFGNSVYDLSISKYDKGDYRIHDFEGTIQATEK
jgi:UDP-glucose 4-epimerase